MEDGGTESSTLQCRGDLHADVEAGREEGVKTAKDDRTSVRSDVVSCTESERELIVKSERRRGGGANEQDETVLLTGLNKKEEEPVENELPEQAAQVFAPALSILHSSPSSPMESQEVWEMESQKSPFLIPQGTPRCENQFDWEEDTPPSTCRHIFVCGGQCRELDGVLIFVCPCVRWVWLPPQGRPEGWRVSDVSSNVLSLLGMGWLCFSAI